MSPIESSSSRHEERATHSVELHVLARTPAQTYFFFCPWLAGPNEAPRSLCQKERGCWCTGCRQSVPPGGAAERAYVADLLKRGCYDAGEASTKQLLQTLSVVMQRLAAIQRAGLVNFGKGRAPVGRLIQIMF